MKYQFFSVPACQPESAQSELNSFLASHRVAAVEKNFVADGDRSFWALCVSYVEPDSRSTIPRRGKVDYREILNEKDFAVFAKLRHLRKTLAEKEGVPAYALFTNDQLAAMVQNRIDNLASLGSIEGVGKARTEKYGQAFLSLLREAMNKREPAEKTSGADSETGKD